MLCIWLLVATHLPGFYCKHRTPLVLVFKSVLALTVVHMTNQSARLAVVAHRKPSSTLLVFQAAMLNGLVHLPALCVGLPLPFWLQLGWVLARAFMFLFASSSRGKRAEGCCGAVWGSSIINRVRVVQPAVSGPAVNWQQNSTETWSLSVWLTAWYWGRPCVLHPQMLCSRQPQLSIVNDTQLFGGFACIRCHPQSAHETTNKLGD